MWWGTLTRKTFTREVYLFVGAFRCGFKFSKGRRVKSAAKDRHEGEKVGTEVQRGASMKLPAKGSLLSGDTETSPCRFAGH